MTSKSAFFITVEGIDGVGKSSAMTSLCQKLSARGINAVATREPGGTVLGEQIRRLLIEPSEDGLASDAELLLFFAARAQHLAKKIKPALKKGQWVVSDRFTDASYAYQSGGRGIATERLQWLEQWVQQDFQPDLTLLLDAPIDICQARATQRGGQADRFEQAEIDFFERVRAVYLQRAAQFPTRFRIIDATQTQIEVNDQIHQLIDQFIDQHNI